jgi:hypothetical protein
MLVALFLGGAVADTVWRLRGCGGSRSFPEGQQLDAERAAIEAAKRLYPKDLIEYRKCAQLLDRSGAGEG